MQKKDLSYPFLDHSTTTPSPGRSHLSSGISKKGSHTEAEWAQNACTHLKEADWGAKVKNAIYAFAYLKISLFKMFPFSFSICFRRMISNSMEHV